MKSIILPVLTVTMSLLTSSVHAACVANGAITTCSGDMTNKSYTDLHGASTIIIEPNTILDILYSDSSSYNYDDIVQVNEGAVVNSIYGDSLTGNLFEASNNQFIVNNANVGVIYGSAINVTRAETYYAGDNKFSIENGATVSIVASEYNVVTGPYADTGGGLTIVTGHNVIDVNDSTVVSRGIIGSHISVSTGIAKPVTIKPSDHGGNVITINNSTVTTVTGSDLIINSSASGVIDWTAGNDVITINNSTVSDVFGSYISNNSSNVVVTSADGHDIITLNNTKVLNDVHAGFGNDSIILSGNTQVLGLVDGVAGVNLLNFNAFTGDFTSINYENIQTVSLTNGTNAHFGSNFSTLPTDVFALDSNSKITMMGHGSGQYVINATKTINNGTFDFADGHAGDQLVVNGDLNGHGIYSIDVNLTQADHVIVNGQLQGTQQVDVVTQINNTLNLADSWAVYKNMPNLTIFSTPNDLNLLGQNVIFADNNRLASDKHLGRTTGSPFVWRLHQQGTDWVISPYTGITPPGPTPPGPTPPGPTPGPDPKPIVVPEIAAYAVLKQITYLESLSQIDTMHQRLGVIRFVNVNGQENTESDDVSQKNPWSAWAKIGGSYLNDKGTNSGFQFDGHYNGIHIGADRLFSFQNDIKLITGFYLSEQTGHFNTNGEGVKVDAITGSKIKTDTLTFGGYASLFKNLSYADLSIRYSKLKADIDADGLTPKVDGHSYSASLEIGQGFILGNNFLIEPQAQLIYFKNTWNDFNDKINNISFNNEYALIGRLGIRLDKTFSLTNKTVINPWMRASLLHNFNSQSTFEYSGFEFNNDSIKDLGSFELGVSYKINKNTMVYSSFSYLNDFKDFTSSKLELGVRLSW